MRDCDQTFDYIAEWMLSDDGVNLFDLLEYFELIYIIFDWLINPTLFKLQQFADLFDLHIIIFIIKRHSAIRFSALLIKVN